MKIFHHILCLLLVAMASACSQDDLDVSALSPDQRAWIGRAVNFNVSVADAFTHRATSYTNNDDGTFNQNDRMRIYRNYLGDDGKWESTSVYRTYYLKHRYAAGNISLGVDWLPEAGRQGYDDKDGDGTYTTFTQTEDDSLTWENGKTLRFRAWSQSNYNNVLYNASKTYFYPDFCMAGWVNASGPTSGIPLVLNHLGSRIVFKVRQSGNQIQRVELCADINPDGTLREDGWKDYKYPDNADITDSDNGTGEAGKSDALAKTQSAAVTEVYKRMCMPAGVNMNNATLYAVKKDAWNGLSNDQVRRLEEQDASIFIPYGTMDADAIAAEAKRPFFCGINGGQYFITIPYDISTGDYQGDVLVLPPITRFRIYMYDVNNGDGFNTPGYEGKYHIFSLQDIPLLDAKGNIVTDANGKPEPAFPYGLKMSPGVSYTFRVGYRYGSLYVVADKSLSWTDAPSTDANGSDQSAEQPVSTTKDYQWWKDAIATACENAGTSDYKPEFVISDTKEFLEFIHLVNGTAATRTDGLYRLVKTYKETNVGGQVIREPDTYGWSLTNSQFNPVWIEEAEAEEMGYIFYDRYYPANADQAAHSERDYLKGPYPFYDDNLRINFTVRLANDLDLKDWMLESIGNAAANPFMGCFDGQGHTLTNVYMKDECLFGFMNGRAPYGASVTNLKIESTHPTALLNTGVNPIYLAGISLTAPSTSSSIARSLTMEDGVNGTSYVVGCIHVGDAGGAMVGYAGNVNMMGCMQAAEGLAGGALIGTDANGLLSPQIKLSAQKVNSKTAALKPTFRNFMCNYYDKTLSPAANAIGSTTDDYSLREYIRGGTTDILRAKNDYLVHNVPMSTLLKQSNYEQYYGLAPWHAMNYAIWWYNANRGSHHPCTMHYEPGSTSYVHRYPSLVPGQQTSNDVKSWNPIEQPN